MPAGADEDTVIYFADFETTTGPNNWTAVDLTNPGPTWHTDTYNAYSGHSWWSGKTSLMGYDNHWLQYLVTPVINLAGTTDPALTLKLYWAVEDTSHTPGYDGWDGCNVWISITGGNTWDVLEPEYPAYTCQSLYGFGWLWGMGPGIPGWAGSSGGWTEARFDLSAYAYPDVRLRFAFCSDAATCTADNPALLGFFIDNVEVRAGSTVYLSNNAEGGGYPSALTVSAGPPSGNYWVLTTGESHSPSHSRNCDDRYFLSNALVSPTVALPADSATYLSYWVYCDLPDVDGDNDDYLDDYYYIEVAPANSAIWTPLAYDWAHNGSQFQWVERSNGYWENTIIPVLDLTPWAGQNVKIRFRMVTDGNSDGGQGDGLYIDDITLVSRSLPDHDVGATRLVVPFPTYQGQGPVNCSVQLCNYGLYNAPQVPAYWAVDGAATALIPWSSVASGDTVIRNFTWTPPPAGQYWVNAYTQLTLDEVRSNDTCVAGLIEVTPPGFFELGYDHRQITYLPDFYPFNLNPGNGPLVRFTPAADGLPGILAGNTIKAMFYSAGTFDLHIYAAGTGGSPGAEVYSRTVTVPAANVYPDWMEIDISDVGYLQGGHPDFWVWFEITAPDLTPHITGHLEDAYSTGHFFVFNGAQAEPTLVNFNIRATLTGSAAVYPEPGRPGTYGLDLLPNYPNPFNATTRIAFTLPGPAEVRLDLFDAAGRKVAELLRGPLGAGYHTAVWEATGQPSGNYWIRLQADGHLRTQRLVLLK